MRRPNRPNSRPKRLPGTTQMEVIVTIPKGLQDALAHLSGRRPPEEYISRTVTGALQDWLLHLELGPIGASRTADPQTTQAAVHQSTRQARCGYQGLANVLPDLDSLLAQGGPRARRCTDCLASLGHPEQQEQPPTQADAPEQSDLRCWNGQSCPGGGGNCSQCGAWLCTPQTPFQGQNPRARHPLAQEVKDSQQNGWPGGDLVHMLCPVCGSSWEQELPQ